MTRSFIALSGAALLALFMGCNGVSEITPENVEPENTEDVNAKIQAEMERMQSHLGDSLPEGQTAPSADQAKAQADAALKAGSGGGDAGGGDAGDGGEAKK
ncbi:MAG: hypothetical protein QGG36_30700 [Pirellulaceae bacterium]|nr:hypothetical protein [Pirellulaceae bacterium]MDP7020207.1 hypothetical protein [Pirellulaceae bacterium]